MYLVVYVLSFTLMIQMYYYHFTQTKKRNIKDIHLTSFSNTIVLHHGNIM